MGIMVYSLFWVMQDLYHQPWDIDIPKKPTRSPEKQGASNSASLNPKPEALHTKIVLVIM